MVGHPSVGLKQTQTPRAGFRPPSSGENALESFAGQRVAAVVVVDNNDPAVWVRVDSSAASGFPSQREAVFFQGSN